ncbi:hypothetical protein EJB05_51379, partial [Eragrostis curvula]
MSPTQNYERVRREREEVQAAASMEESLRRNCSSLKRHSGAGDVATRKKMRTIGKDDAGIGCSSVISGHGSNSPTVPPNWKPRLPLRRNHNSLKRHTNMTKSKDSAGAGGVSSTKNKRTDAGIAFSSVVSGPSQKPRPPFLSKTATPFDFRPFLLEKAKGDLKNKLKEFESKTSQVAASGKAREKHEPNGEDDKTHAANNPTTIKDAHVQPEENNFGDNTDAENDYLLSYNVPDPDFHDFDKDRSEESFQSAQIWATYDDEDGMPRYYALISGSLESVKTVQCSTFSLTRLNGRKVNVESSKFIHRKIGRKFRKVLFDLAFDLDAQAELQMSIMYAL